jgi:hypothetical protein
MANSNDGAKVCRERAQHEREAAAAAATNLPRVKEQHLTSAFK